MLRLLPAFCCLFLLCACNTVPPYLNVYDGLLPAGYQMKASPEPINTAALKTRTLVLVTSTNFNNYTTQWQEFYEKGGYEKRQGMIRGAAAVLSLLNPVAPIGSGLAKGADAADSDGSRIRQASDPRNVVNRVYASLRPYFKTVGAASDFAEARERKADYIVLIDYYGSFNGMGTVYTTKGGVYLLDASLRSVFKAEGNAEVDREEPSIFGGPSALDILAKTYTKGLDITTTQILTGMRTKLGPPSQ